MPLAKVERVSIIPFSGGDQSQTALASLNYSSVEAIFSGAKAIITVCQSTVYLVTQDSALEMRKTKHARRADCYHNDQGISWLATGAHLFRKPR